MTKSRRTEKSDSHTDVVAGRYQLQRLLGQGAVSAVYSALDHQLDREVAVKVFLASATTVKDIDAQRSEMRLLAGLSHHGIVTLLDAGVDLTDSDRPRSYLVMEVAPGSDLQQRLLREEFSARQIAAIGCDLAEGLEYIHQFQIVHRDVKPANVLIVEDTGEPTRLHAKLTDFGIAVPMEELPAPVGSVTLGTAAYLSPEQVLGEPLGPPSDIYSLGLVLLECFTRKLAFPGGVQESALARLSHDPVIPPDLTDEWKRLIAAMTAYEPDDRPSIREVVLALRHATNPVAARHKDGRDLVREGLESQRMDEVHRYEILDTPPDGAFDQITAMAARLLAVPIAIVSIVDHDRIWFKSHHGTDIEQIARDPGLCASAILGNEPWVVEDARHDPRALTNPLVAGEFGLNFYAGVPLRTRDGYNLGTLCVLDLKPRTITAEELVTLKELAGLVIHELELRLASRQPTSPQYERQDQEKLWAH